MRDEDRGSAHLSAERLAAFVDGRLTSAEKAAALAHFGDCAECRREMVDVHRVLAGATHRSVAPVEPARVRVLTPVRVVSRRGRLSTLGPAIAAIAAALAFVFVPPMLREDAGTSVAVRGPDRVTQPEAVTTLAIVSPRADSVVTAGSTSFVWRSASADAEYRFTLMDGTGGVVWSKRTNDTVLTLPAEIRLAPASEYFWSVDALLADGHSLTTRVQHFSVR